MAEEKKEMTLVELRAKAESLVKEYNDAVQNGKFDLSAKLNDEIEDTVNQYTSVSRTDCFKELRKADDPMIEAVKKLTYPTIRKKDTKEGELKIPVRTIEDTEKTIDPLALHKFIGGDGIGRDKGWFYKIEKLNLLMTAQKAVDLGIDPKSIHDSYAMNDISRAIDLGKTPTSKTNILRTVQFIVDAMIGPEYKATSHDVNFLLSVYSRKSRQALTVTCANHKYMRQYMTEICHRIVTEKTYAVDYKKAQGK